MLRKLFSEAQKYQFVMNLFEAREILSTKFHHRMEAASMGLSRTWV